MAETDFELVDAYAELLADTRAYLEAESARGARYVWPQSAGLSESQSPEPILAEAEVSAPGAGSGNGLRPYTERGPETARLVVVGQSIGRSSAGNGVDVWSVAAGSMLEKMLQNVLNLRPEDVLLIDLISEKASGKNGQSGRGAELPIGSLQERLSEIRPAAILLMGQAALDAALGGRRELLGIRGQWQECAFGLAMPTFHPEYLLRNPEAKRAVFQDLKAVNKTLQAQRGAL